MVKLCVSINLLFLCNCALSANVRFPASSNQETYVFGNLTGFGGSTVSVLVKPPHLKQRYEGIVAGRDQREMNSKKFQKKTLSRHFKEGYALSRGVYDGINRIHADQETQDDRPWKATEQYKKGEARGTGYYDAVKGTGTRHADKYQTDGLSHDYEMGFTAGTAMGTMLNTVTNTVDLKQYPHVNAVQWVESESFDNTE